MSEKATKYKNLLAGFWRGIGSTAEIYDSPKYVIVAAHSSRDAMRSDWLKIGGDFREVIREHGKKAQTNE